MRRTPSFSGLGFVVLITLGLAVPGLAQGQTGGAEAATPAPKRVLDYAQVLFVRAARNASGTWSFDVTVRHNDEGWDHYADAWQILDPETGTVIAERVLAHPHDDEQPFTRSLGGIRIPPRVAKVIVRAKCDRHGFGGQEVLVDLTSSAGEGFEVSAR
jgi:hypothetical protein